MFCAKHPVSASAFLKRKKKNKKTKKTGKYCVLYSQVSWNKNMESIDFYVFFFVLPLLNSILKTVVQFELY